MTFLVEAKPGEVAAFRQDYEAPTVGQIDPSFVHMHPAVMERSDFEALEEYKEPVEPRVIDAFDYRRQAELTAEAAEELVDTIANRLDRQETVHDKVFEIVRSKRFRAGTVKQTRFEENRELFRPLIEAHVEAGTPLEFVLPSFPFKHRNPVKVVEGSGPTERGRLLGFADLLSGLCGAALTVVAGLTLARIGVEAICIAGAVIATAAALWIASRGRGSA